MTLYKFRDRFLGFSVRVGVTFSRLGLSPNQWTLASLIPALLAVYFLVSQNFIAAAFLFLLSAFLDLVDGSVARVTGRVTMLGAYLDAIVDRYVEAIIIFGLLFSGLPGLYMPSEIWISLYLFGTMMAIYAKAAAREKDIVEREMRGGLLERPERLVILFIGILIASISVIYLTYVVVLLAVLTNITALQRIYIVSGKAREA
jgi:phosphatidylglycerophosphate synthase